MKMVGATNGFIRWPFVYEGFMLGLLGAVARTAGIAKMGFVTQPEGEK